MSETELERVSAALAYALNVIEGYQGEILDTPNDHFPIDLGQMGFCQGMIYRDAVKMIMKRAGWDDENRHQAALLGDQPHA